MNYLLIIFSIFVISSCAVNKKTPMPPLENEVPQSSGMAVWIKIAMPNEKNKNPTDNPVSTASIFNLTQIEIDLLNIKANDGDSEAAFRLAQYFTFVENKSNKKKYWLEIAEKNKHPAAAYNLAFEYFTFDKDLGKAKMWALIAFENGSEKQNHCFN